MSCERGSSNRPGGTGVAHGTAHPYVSKATFRTESVVKVALLSSAPRDLRPEPVRRSAQRGAGVSQGCAIGAVCDERAVSRDEPRRAEPGHGDEPVTLEVTDDGAADGSTVEPGPVQGHDGVGGFGPPDELDLEP